VPTSSLPAPCRIISDAHIGIDRPGGTSERALLAMCDAIRDGSLLINGDLFDFWFEWSTVIPRASFRVLAALAALRDRGVPILWVAGNHDCWGGTILRADADIDYHLGPWEGMVAGWRTRVEHGDGLREREDRGYRAIRPVLRHPLAVRAFRWLPADLASRLASGSSHASRTYRARDHGAGLRAIARRRLAAPDAPSLLVYGHSHVAALERVGRSVYANAGSWTDAADGPGPTYLVVTPERIDLCVWRTSTERDRLDTIEYRALAEEPATGAQEMVGGVGGDETVRR